MKLTNAIAVLIITAGSALGMQSPNILDSTRAQLNASQQPKNDAINAALGSSQGQNTKPAAPAAKPSPAQPASKSTTATKAPTPAPVQSNAKPAVSANAATKAPAQPTPVQTSAKPAANVKPVASTKPAAVTPVAVKPAVNAQAQPNKAQPVQPVKTQAISVVPAPAKAVPANSKANAATSSANTSKPNVPGAVTPVKNAQVVPAKNAPTQKIVAVAPANIKADANKPAVPQTKAAAETKPSDNKADSKAQETKDADSQVAIQDSKTADKSASKEINFTGHRDPFVSPVVNRGNSGSGCSTGKRCLAIDQINLRGIIKSEGGMIAVVTNALDKAYFLRENDPVFNGYVVKITGDSVIFKETFEDKLGKPLTREVTKTISTPAV